MKYCNWDAVHRAIEAASDLPKPGQTGELHRKREVGAHNALLVLIIIAAHINRDSEETYLTYETIAKESLMSPASVWRAVDALVTSGHLLKESGGKGRRDCNTYRFGPAMASEVKMDVKKSVLLTAATPRDQAPVRTLTCEAANAFVTRFAELLNQPAKHSESQRASWPALAENLLSRRSLDDLIAIVDWIFKVDTFWAPKLREYSGDPMSYFEQKLDTMSAAMAHPASKADHRKPSPPRNPPGGANFDINDLLAHSTI